MALVFRKKPGRNQAGGVHVILLLGASGYIGFAFQKEIVQRKISYAAPKRSDLDYTTVKGFRDLLGHLQPKLVINAAAYITKPSVDDCNQHKQACLEGNTIFPAMLSAVCHSEGVPLLHVSTGCLYNGDNDHNGFSETDPAQLSFDTSCSWYVGCKEMAERIVLKNPNAWVCRMRLPFDQFEGPRNLLTKLQWFAYVCSETQSITHRSDFVEACLDMWQIGAPFGLYNVTSPGGVSYQWICERINQVLHKGKREFYFLSPAQLDKLMNKSNKSRCVLSVAKLLKTGVQMRPVGDAIEDSLQHWIPESVS